MYGKDYPYAQTRIQGTILRLLETGEPVYVNLVQNNGICLVTPLEKQWGDLENAKKVHVDDLNMHPVPLGYVNCAGEATYLMRIPLRRDWKQGLRQENCWSSGRMLNNIPMKDLKHCIMNVYPSFQNAVKGTKSGLKNKMSKTIAWHRHWAVSTNGIVMYRNHEPVGKLTDKSIELDESHRYLREALEESMK